MCVFQWRKQTSPSIQSKGDSYVADYLTSYNSPWFSGPYVIYIVYIHIICSTSIINRILLLLYNIIYMYLYV